MRRSISALAIAAAMPLATAANAAEAVKGSVGGYMWMGMGVSDGSEGPVGSDGDHEVGVLRDGEIHLKATGYSDNGLTFDVQVELEAFTDTNDQIDENWGRVRGSFGEIYIGAADTALNEYGGVGAVYVAGPVFNYYDSDNSTMSSAPKLFIGEYDSLAIRYGTYELLGDFELGVSYSPNGDTDGPNDTAYGFSSRGPGKSTEKDQFAFGGNYSSEFEAFKLAIGGGFLTSDGSAGQDLYHIGAAIGFSGFTVAGLYNRHELDADADFDRWAIGAMYATGPWEFGGGVTITDYETSRLDEEYYGTVEVGYNIAPGLFAGLTAEIGDDDNNDTGFGMHGYLGIKF